MADDLQVAVKDIIPTPAGCGVFLEHGGKCIAIFVDNNVAAAITMSLHKIRKPRPLTHDLMGNILAGLGVKVQKVIIHDVREETFYARLYLLQESELGKSLVEIDSRPSDAIALALRQQAPILVSRHVWDATKDMTWALKQAGQPPADPGKNTPSSDD